MARHCEIFVASGVWSACLSNALPPDGLASERTDRPARSCRGVARNPNNARSAVRKEAMRGLLAEVKTRPGVLCPSDRQLNHAILSMSRHSRGPVTAAIIFGRVNDIARFTSPARRVDTGVSTRRRSASCVGDEPLVDGVADVSLQRSSHASADALPDSVSGTL